jgi:hypothetical protein
MKSAKFPFRLFIAAFFMTLTTTVFAGETNSPREKLLLDFNWKFHLGNEWGAAVSLA